MPWEHYIGRLSEEFGGALPLEVFRNLAALPVGFMEQLIEYRHFAQAKRAIDGATTKDQRRALREHWPMAALAETIRFEQMEREMGLG